MFPYCEFTYNSFNSIRIYLVNSEASVSHGPPEPHLRNPGFHGIALRNVETLDNLTKCQYCKTSCQKMKNNHPRCTCIHNRRSRLPNPNARVQQL